MKTRSRSACTVCRRKKIRCKGDSYPCATCVERKSVTECEFLHVDESHSTREQTSSLFTADVRRKFLETREMGSTEPMPSQLDASSQAAEHEREPFTSNDSSTNQVLLGTESSESSNWVSVRLGDKQKIRNYYEKTLGLFKQDNCSVVARAFIRYIEPRKQTLHPYNGHTIPGWWPSDVSYGAPDKLGKRNRIKLLCHIISNVGEHGVTADKLEQVVSGSQLKDPSRGELIYDILRVRKMEEQLEDGALPSDTPVFINRNLLADNEIPTDEASATPGIYERGPVFPVSQRAANLTSIDTMSSPLSAPLNSSNPVTVSAPSDYTDYPVQSMPYALGPELISPPYALVPNHADGNTATLNPRFLPTTSPYYQTWKQDFGPVIVSPANYAAQPSTHFPATFL